jgi:putative oxidoreductase
VVSELGLFRTLLRIVIGLLFVGHGGQKLLGWFGGDGLDASTAEMRALRLEPARANAVLAGASQLVAGAFVAVGLLTTFGCAVIAANMITAIRTACAGKGPWGLRGGWEYQLVLTLALLALAEDGPGKLSLDHLIGIDYWSARWAAGALVAAVLAATTAIVLGRSLRPAPTERAVE